MRSLFLRVFLWFWFALALVVALLVVSSPLLTRNRPGIERWQHSSESRVEEIATRIRERVETEGPDFYLESQHRRHGHSPLRVSVFTADGSDVLGGEPPPPQVVRAARRAARSGTPVVERSGGHHLVAEQVAGPDGTRFILVVSLWRPPRIVDLLEPGILLPRLAALILVAGVLCYWLARYLARPAGALRDATRRLAGGDLSARVGGKVGSRRDELGDLARDFDTMAERIEALVGAQKRLLRDVSHELRSPLARLSVALELARRKTRETAREPLDRIEQEADRLEQMIAQVLTLARLDSGSEELCEEAVELVALVREVVDDASFEADARGCGVELDAAASELWVTGSAELLRSALENVVRNAVRYTAQASTVEVQVAEDRPAGMALVKVRDRGPGVPAEDLGRVFEPFFRVADARDRASGGTGLGLAITARAVSRHGGDVAARNADPGLAVELRLPLRGVG